MRCCADISPITINQAKILSEFQHQQEGQLTVEPKRKL